MNTTYLKKIVAATSACALALCAAGCGNTTTQNSAANTAAEATAAPTAAETTAAATSAKTGIVLEASMHNITIEAPDGSTYAFVTDDNTEFIGESENLGDTVSVSYDGEYAENCLAKVIKVDQKASADVSVSAEEVTPAPSNVTAKGSDEVHDDNAIRYITAVVQDASMNSMTVEWGGNTYTVLKDDNTTVEGSPAVGSTVRIYHHGALTDGMTAIDISVVDANFADKNVKYITGTVVDASMNTIVIENGGHKYNILKDDNTKSDSVQVGDTVRVYHTGSFADGMTALSIIKQ